MWVVRALLSVGGLVFVWLVKRVLDAANDIAKDAIKERLLAWMTQAQKAWAARLSGEQAGGQLEEALVLATEVPALITWVARALLTVLALALLSGAVITSGALFGAVDGGKWPVIGGYAVGVIGLLLAAGQALRFERRLVIVEVAPVLDDVIEGMGAALTSGTGKAVTKRGTEVTLRTYDEVMAEEEARRAQDKSGD